MSDWGDTMYSSFQGRGCEKGRAAAYQLSHQSRERSSRRALSASDLQAEMMSFSNAVRKEEKKWEESSSRQIFYSKSADFWLLGVGRTNLEQKKNVWACLGLDNSGLVGPCKILRFSFPHFLVAGA